MAASTIKRLPEWAYGAIERMVREQIGIRAAALAEGVEISTEEGLALSKRKEFQRVLYETRNRYFQEIGANPTRTKTAFEGLLVYLINKMVDDGEYDKAVDAVLKLAKIAGWVGTEGQVNVFAGLSAKELEETKKRILGMVDKKDLVN